MFGLHKSAFGLLTLGAIVRVGLIGFGEWQDANFPVKYTDVDYAVFTDAARFVSEGESPVRTFC